MQVVKAQSDVLLPNTHTHTHTQKKVFFVIFAVFFSQMKLFLLLTMSKNIKPGQEDKNVL